MHTAIENFIDDDCIDELYNIFTQNMDIAAEHNGLHILPLGALMGASQQYVSDVCMRVFEEVKKKHRRVNVLGRTEFWHMPENFWIDARVERDSINVYFEIYLSAYDSGETIVEGVPIEAKPGKLLFYETGLNTVRTERSQGADKYVLTGYFRQR